MSLFKRITFVVIIMFSAQSLACSPTEDSSNSCGDEYNNSGIIVASGLFIAAGIAIYYSYSASESGSDKLIHQEPESAYQLNFTQLPNGESDGAQLQFTFSF